jgi:hypothetical protein
LDIAKPSTLSDIPPWQLLKPKVDTSLSEYKPKVDTSLSEYKKSETNPVVFNQELRELKQLKPLKFTPMDRKINVRLLLLP